MREVRQSMPAYEVKVWGRPVEIEIYQKSKSVWVATGSYLNETITVTGRSVGSAMIGWRRAAEYRGG